MKILSYHQLFPEQHLFWNQELIHRFSLVYILHPEDPGAGCSAQGHGERAVLSPVSGVQEPQGVPQAAAGRPAVRRAVLQDVREHRRPPGRGLQAVRPVRAGQAE